MMGMFGWVISLLLSITVCQLVIKRCNAFGRLAFAKRVFALLLRLNLADAIVIFAPLCLFGNEFGQSYQRDYVRDNHELVERIGQSKK